jgi:hypothetical protein
LLLAFLTFGLLYLQAYFQTLEMFSTNYSRDTMLTVMVAHQEVRTPHHQG